MWLLNAKYTYKWECDDDDDEEEEDDDDFDKRSMCLVLWLLSVLNSECSFK